MFTASTLYRRPAKYSARDIIATSSFLTGDISQMTFAPMPTKAKADVIAQLASVRAATVVWKVKFTPNYALPDHL